MDTLTSAQRSERMSRVRSKNSKPEMEVRSLVHSMGFRYILHDASLPGSPDLVFPSKWELYSSKDVFMCQALLEMAIYMIVQSWRVSY